MGTLSLSGSYAPYWLAYVPETEDLHPSLNLAEYCKVLKAE
jgi:hypothetical protein